MHAAPTSKNARGDVANSARPPKRDRRLLLPRQLQEQEEEDPERPDAADAADAEDEGFTLATPPRAGGKQTDSRRASAAGRLAPQVTVLFKPNTQGASLRKLSRYDLSEELKHLRGLGEIRINARLNLVAVDTVRDDTRDVLTRASLPRGCARAAVPCLEGGTHARGGAEELIARIKTPVPIIGGSRKGQLLFLTFLGRQPPTHVFLSHIRVPVELLTARNLQCGHCYNFGHVRVLAPPHTKLRGPRAPLLQLLGAPLGNGHKMPRAPDRNAVTVLFKPNTQGANLRHLSRYDLSEELKHLRGLGEIRINARLNLVAVDTARDDTRDALLGLRSLGGVPVQPYPASKEGRTRAAAHSADTPITTDVCCIDEARNVITDNLRGDHPDPRVASGDPPPRVPTNKLSRQDSALLSRLRTGCAVTNSRLHLYKKRDSPACSHCGAFDSIGHCIVVCAAYNNERARLRAAYKRLGIPCSTKTELLFPRCPRSLLAGAYRHLLAFLEETGLASRLIKTPVPIIGGSRKGQLLFLTFLGRQPPTHVFLSHIRVPVELLTARNLQCGHCYNFGHVRTACRGAARCARLRGPRAPLLQLLGAPLGNGHKMPRAPTATLSPPTAHIQPPQLYENGPLAPRHWSVHHTPAGCERQPPRPYYSMKLEKRSPI
ncbi:hypothetical protein HPB48_012098 [Haemaphysalis longicornis]|uniref:Uncharacterized protein n=1 Tax=Haemaphysalis longicornis TaxID=44386 RepID=A0A9J6GAM7_HAELO|nr:hypothetical protein HPB48_012098 [Haemaphysalis longicornis]